MSFLYSNNEYRALLGGPSAMKMKKKINRIKKIWEELMLVEISPTGSAISQSSGN